MLTPDPPDPDLDPVTSSADARNARTARPPAGATVWRVTAGSG